MSSDYEYSDDDDVYYEDDDDMSGVQEDEGEHRPLLDTGCVHILLLLMLERGRF